MKLVFNPNSCYPFGAYGEDKAIKNDVEEVVARVINRGDNDGAERLATLLAAAPRMLAALKKVDAAYRQAGDWRGSADAIVAVRNALQKAETCPA
jgi:hypothetical protein